MLTKPVSVTAAAFTLLLSAELAREVAAGGDLSGHGGHLHNYVTVPLPTHQYVGHAPVVQPHAGHIEPAYGLVASEAHHGDSAAGHGGHDEPAYSPQPYKFGYEIVDEYGNKQSRHEVSDESNAKKGSYSFTDAHGISRRVDYVADQHGFRATVHTNEPGTASSEPAGAQYVVDHSGPSDYHNHHHQHQHQQALGVAAAVATPAVVYGAAYPSHDYHSHEHHH